MTISEYTNTIIQNYCDSTGMPAASLSVSDYLLMRKAAGEELLFGHQAEIRKTEVQPAATPTKEGTTDNMRNNLREKVYEQHRETSRRQVQAPSQAEEPDNIVDILNALPD